MTEDKYHTGGEKLQEGKHCSDCVHFKRVCSWLMSYNGTETTCSWFPSKFIELATVVVDKIEKMEDGESGGGMSAEQVRAALQPYFDQCERKF